MRTPAVQLSGSEKDHAVLEPLSASLFRPHTTVLMMLLGQVGRYAPSPEHG